MISVQFTTDHLHSPTREARDVAMRVMFVTSAMHEVDAMNIHIS